MLQRPNVFICMYYCRMYQGAAKLKRTHFSERELKYNRSHYTMRLSAIHVYTFLSLAIYDIYMCI